MWLVPHTLALPVLRLGGLAGSSPLAVCCVPHPHHSLRGHREVVCTPAPTPVPASRPGGNECLPGALRLVKAAQGGLEAPGSQGAGRALRGLSSSQQLCGCHLHFLWFHPAGLCQGLACRLDEAGVSRPGVQAPSEQSLWAERRRVGLPGFVPGAHPHRPHPCPRPSQGQPCTWPGLTSWISWAVAGAWHLEGLSGALLLWGASSGRDPGMGLLLTSGMGDSALGRCSKGTKTPRGCWGHWDPAKSQLFRVDLSQDPGPAVPGRGQEGPGLQARLPRSAVLSTSPHRTCCAVLRARWGEGWVVVSRPPPGQWATL